jgi:16S rRNA (cytidine1402-2'-O)-methyltransferase
MLKNRQASMVGTLYLVATPIGNLEDMTFRAVRVLTEADAVFCEDTRRTGILLRHFGVERASAPESFHDRSSRAALEKVRRLLAEGARVAYVTDAGMPVVSDPGYVLVRAALDAGARVEPIPGPSAALALFAASGLSSPKFFFHGFFPRVRGEVERVLEVVRANPVAHVFYEAPGRAAASLGILAKHLPESAMALGRELTKVHEEILRGTAEELAAEIGGRERVRGEIVFAILGGQPSAVGSARESAVTPEEAAAAKQPPELTLEQQAEVTALVQSGVSSKDAAKELSKKFRLPRRVIYEFIIRRLT